jgi:CheY-like chemotaxis protein/anti-sigma regulatory factor (Ser/Thr protein kinase)
MIGARPVTEVQPLKSILVVEDDNAIRQLLSQFLEGAGYIVDTAEDGIEGLEKLRAKSYDLMLLDVWMPRMNGLELLAQLHSEPSRPKVIVMTADNTPQTLLTSIREQAYQYMCKPFDRNALMEMVSQVLAAPAEASLIEVISARPEWVELLVPCEMEIVDRIQNFLEHLKADLPSDIRESVGRAFHELLLNAIEWGGQLDPNRKVRIAFLRARRMLLYRIADPGKGFNLEALPHAAVSNPASQPFDHVKVRDEMGLRAGGFGILLARAMVDELIYNEARNEVVFVKYLD